MHSRAVILGSIPALLLTLLCPQAGAVVVAGASGGGNTTNNTTQAQLESELSTSFPAFSNLVPYSDASGIYLGYNAATKDVWVLTARHVTSNASAGATIVIDGLTYTRQSEGVDGFGLLPGGDVRLVRYRRADLAVPSLPAVPLASTLAGAGTQVVMIGNGQNRTQNASTSPGTSDAVTLAAGVTGYNWTTPRLIRWGTNQVEAEFLNILESGTPVSGVLGTFSMGPYTTVGFATDFDSPSGGQWLSSNEAQASLGDSGGGVFRLVGSEWQLAGIHSAVITITGQPSSTAAFGNLTLITDIQTYESSIQSAIGATLVPEPTSALLLAVSSVPLLSARRRAVRK